MENAQIALAVLLSPALNLNFVAIDDMDQMPNLPPVEGVQSLAKRQNQDVKAAFAAMQQAKSDITVAIASFFPT